MSENQSMRKMKDRKRNFPSIRKRWRRKTTSLATQKDKKDEKNTEKRTELGERNIKNYWKKYRITQFISRKKVKNFSSVVRWELNSLRAQARRRIVYNEIVIRYDKGGQTTQHTSDRNQQQSLMQRMMREKENCVNIGVHVKTTYLN